MARDLRVKARFQAVDEASKPISKIGKQLNGLKSALQNIAAITGVALVFRTIIRAITDAIRVSSDYEKTLLGLESAAKRFGDQQDVVVKGAVAQAEALQKLTGVSDSTTISQQSLLLELGVTAEQLSQATQASFDMSAALGISLDAAARNVGRTMGGFAGELGELVPELKELSAEALKSGEGIDLLADKFAGRAAANAASLQVSIGRLESALSDLQKTAGLVSDESGGLSDFVRGLAVMLERANEGAKAIGGLETSFGSLLKSLNPVTSALADIIDRVQTLGREGLQEATENAEDFGSALTTIGTGADFATLRLDAMRDVMEALQLIESQASVETVALTAATDALVFAVSNGSEAFRDATRDVGGYVTAVRAAIQAQSDFQSESSTGGAQGATALKLSVDQLFALQQDVRNTLPIRSGGGLFRVNADGSRTLIPGTGLFIRETSFQGRG